MDPADKFVPADFSQVRAAKLKSDKDLEAEIPKLAETLKDTRNFDCSPAETHDWQKRTDSLKRVCELAAALLQPSCSLTLQGALAAFSKLQQPLQA